MNRKVINIILGAAILGCAAFTAYSVLRVSQIDNVYDTAAGLYSDISDKYAATASQDGEGDKDIERTPISIDFDALQEECTDGTVVGWLYCDDGVINYPVVQGSDNYYFLEHLIDGSENASGTLFVDVRNHADWSDRNTVIYGHHMSDQSMFGGLYKYRSQEYAAEHPVMYLNTPSSGDYKLVFIGCYVDETDTLAFKTNFGSDSEYLEFLNYSSQHFMNPAEDTLTVEDNVITLITCSYEANNVRQVTVLKAIPVGPAK